MDALTASLDALITNPELAPLLSLLKGIRNGAVYGAKVRFPHALVMILLFRSGTFREKAKLVLKATRQHARNLATFALIYKGSMILLRNIKPVAVGKEGRYDSFFAGLLGGYAVFGRHKTSITQQIVIYIFARVVLALAKLAIRPGMHPLSPLITPQTRAQMEINAWPVFASLSWAFVMYIFRWHPDTLMSSLRSSMVYIYADSDHWDSFRNFLIHNK
ncbi:Tim17/Tim22/Tim23/Pmp24 family protein [Aspergillus homomorphus CBS 101889]|uniref:Putative peroxisomal membrane protein n=1 Tax=Aspergillus homomorphus (strain CBS 101889) TaxID=1450537 RepID=A0A395I1A5_ASPHC|nr:putative peroxisomal membrane protein [Aspergillus homomorphus CBS 101889]RAL13586.1 putative peroxisomal membrane protein [Aspergillus homomorphus CBS 101889]